MKTAVIYARYSSDSQTEQSIEGQLRVCQEFAKQNDIFIVGTYIDRAMTGTNDLRPDFQRMIKDSGKHAWDYVLVYKLDRFSRNKYEATIHKHTLRENGVKLLSAMENIPDTPEGIILESLLEGMNQYYSAELSQKVHRGLNESYRKGLYTGGSIIFGYDVVNRKNVINESEAAVIREIFTKYSQGYTAAKIAEELKARGVRTKKGNYIPEKKVYVFLQNTKYNGKIKHGDIVYDNIYPKIVDDVTWQKVQDIRRENQHAPSRKKEIYDFILSGKLVCGKCGHMLVGESGTSHNGTIYYYYTCLARRRKQHPCSAKAVDKQWLENLVIFNTWRLLCADETTVPLIAKTLCKIHETESKKCSILKSLEAQRKNALKASQNLIAALEQGIITEQTKIRLKEIETQIAKLDFDIEQEKQRNYSFLTEEMIEKYLRGVICGDINDIGIRKLLVRTFIREVLLDNDSVIITYHFSDTYTKYKITAESANQVKKQSVKKTAFPLQFGSYIFTPPAPAF